MGERGRAAGDGKQPHGRRAGREAEGREAEGSCRPLVSLCCIKKKEPTYIYVKRDGYQNSCREEAGGKEIWPRSALKNVAEGKCLRGLERCGGREIWLRGNSEECTGKGAKNQRIKASDRVGAGLRIFREN